MNILDWFEDLAEAIIISDYEYEYNLLFSNENKKEFIDYNFSDCHGAISIR